MAINFKVYRYDGEAGTKPTFQSYEVDLKETDTVLDGMLKIREEQDGTLAFRGSCRRGICGECAMRINKKGRLACMERVKGKEITVEPIRNIGVIKDLVFDMESFLWSKVRTVRPWMMPREPVPQEEYPLSGDNVRALRKAMSCIMCGLCDEGCTVIAVDKTFLGPAALTRAYRYVFDPRDGATQKRLKLLDGPRGMWDCTHCFEANGHCPKGIDPTDRIFDLRDEAIRRGITNQRVARHHDSFAASVKASGWLDEGRLALETEGILNLRGLMGLVPTAVRALVRGKFPFPYLHPRRPGSRRIASIFEKVERKQK